MYLPLLILKLSHPWTVPSMTHTTSFLWKQEPSTNCESHVVFVTHHIQCETRVKAKYELSTLVSPDSRSCPLLWEHAQGHLSWPAFPDVYTPPISLLPTQLRRNTLLFAFNSYIFQSYFLPLSAPFILASSVTLSIVSFSPVDSHAQVTQC